MRKIPFFMSAIAGIMSLVGCTRIDCVEENPAGTVFHASFETVSATETKTYLNSNRQQLWTTDERVSVFEGNTYNQAYKYVGSTGEITADFVKASTGSSGTELDANYAVYPYNKSTEINASTKVLTLNLPAVQKYAEGSFGLCANTMVAVTDGKDNRNLPFRNICGYLVVKIYGYGTVSSVTMEGNDDEKISGTAYVQTASGEDPSLTMADTATTSIEIDCGDGVELGYTEEAAKEFWFCIPPVTFEKGFEVTISLADGRSITKATNSKRIIQRNVYVVMDPVRVMKQGVNTKIGDAFSDGVVFNVDADGGYWLVSLKEERGKPWVESKEWCESLGSGWYMPDIDELAVLQTQLSAVNQVLKTISGATELYKGNECYWSSTENGDCAWRMEMSNGKRHGEGNDERKTSTKNRVRAIKKCTDMDSIISFKDNVVKGICVSHFDTDGDGEVSYKEAEAVTSIDEELFSNNGDIKSFDEFGYFKNVHSIGDQAFYRCTKLHQITIPSNVTSVGDEAFYDVNITSLELPASVTSLGSGCFSSLIISNIVLPSSSPVSVQPDTFINGQTIFVPNNLIAIYYTMRSNWKYHLSLPGCCIYLKPLESYNNENESTLDTSGAIDMGTSVKWAAHNVGAENPEEYGGYYQWAGTNNVAGITIDYGETPAPYYEKHSGDMYVTKYAHGTNAWNQDDKFVLDQMDDVAHSLWGDNWRMPTKEEFQELLDKCEWEFTSYNGVRGIMVYSPETDNKIFLPAAGRYYKNNLNYTGADCYYWSSTLYDNRPATSWLAYNLEFASNYTMDASMSWGLREYGCPIRPVAE